MGYGHSAESALSMARSGGNCPVFIVLFAGDIMCFSFFLGMKWVSTCFKSLNSHRLMDDFETAAHNLSISQYFSNTTAFLVTHFCFFLNWIPLFHPGRAGPGGYTFSRRWTGMCPSSLSLFTNVHHDCLILFVLPGKSLGLHGPSLVFQCFSSEPLNNIIITVG